MKSQDPDWVIKEIKRLRKSYQDLSDAHRVLMKRPRGVTIDALREGIRNAINWHKSEIDRLGGSID